MQEATHSTRLARFAVAGALLAALAVSAFTAGISKIDDQAGGKRSGTIATASSHDGDVTYLAGGGRAGRGLS
jgi:hypothetical protein